MYSGQITESQKALRSQLKNALKGFVIEPSILRVEKVITNNASSYNFDIKKEGNESNSEVKLDTNDVFFATHLGIYLLRAANTERSRAVPQTYPNQVVFPAVAGFVPEHLEIFFNAHLSVKIGTKEFISKLWTGFCRYVPQTQQSTATNHSQRSAYDGLVEIEKIRFSGNDQIEIKLSLNPFESTALQVASATAGVEHRVMLLVNGFLVKGAAQAKTEFGM
ncbi:MAG: hypothetical protein RML94_02580 [Bacteroidia bacterium]|nr:hypothetical protein [Bacteroidia bacterium]